MRRVMTAVLFAVALCAQTPKFDVASLKASPAGARFGPMRGGPGSNDPEHFAWDGVPLSALITNAYGLGGSDQVTGPDWVNMPLYSIAVNVPPSATREQFNAMLQNLLAERLHLTIHHQMTTVDGYNLVVSKSGSKLTESDLSKPAANGGGSFGPQGAVVTYPRTRMMFFANDLARKIRQAMRNPDAPLVRVVDKTGLTGTYDFEMHYVFSDSDVPGPDIFTALESQLGLRVEPVKMQIDMIVVDHADRTPAEN